MIRRELPESVCIPLIGLGGLGNFGFTKSSHVVLGYDDNVDALACGAVTANGGADGLGRQRDRVLLIQPVPVALVEHAERHDASAARRRVLLLEQSAEEVE